MAATAERTEITARDIARSIGVAPRTKRFILRDEYGMACEGRHYTHVFSALARSDKTPDLSSRIHTVAYALLKCMASGRMPAESENRIAVYSPYRMCALVARIANECPETTIGGICDTWLIQNHKSL